MQKENGDNMRVESLMDDVHSNHTTEGATNYNSNAQIIKRKKGDGHDETYSNPYRK